MEKPGKADSEAIFEQLIFRKTLWKEKVRMWKTRSFNSLCGKPLLIVEKTVENVESRKAPFLPAILSSIQTQGAAPFAYYCINMQNAGRFIVNFCRSSGADVLHNIINGLFQVAVLADVLLHGIDGVHNGRVVTLEFGANGLHAHAGDFADDVH